MVTAQELSRLIEHLQVYGEYDSYHEWSLYYTLQNKLDSLEEMLKNWDDTEPAGQKLILNFIQILIKEAYYDPMIIKWKLAEHYHIPEVAAILNGL